MEIVIYPYQWKKDSIVGHEDSLELNEDIEDIISKAKKYYRSCRRESKPFRVSRMLEHIGKIDEVDFIAFLSDQIDNLSLSESSIKKHRDLLGKISKFRKHVYMDDISYSFLIDFRNWMKKQPSRRGGTLSDNYISSLLVLLRSHINEARRMKLLPELDPFLGFKMERTTKDNVVLTEADLDKLYHFDLSKHHKSYLNLRDRFLFLCYTGMRYGDHLKVDKSNVSGNMLKYLAGKTAKKKGKYARVRLDLFEGRAIEIFKRNNYSWSKCDNGHFNRMTRKILEIAEIDIYVTVHTARHTFKSMLLEKGFPLHLIAEMMAHSSTSTTESYGSISDSAILNFEI